MGYGRFKEEKAQQDNNVENVSKRVLVEHPSIKRLNIQSIQYSPPAMVVCAAAVR